RAAPRSRGPPLSPPPERVDPRDRRAVEAHPVVQRLLHLRRGDRERLQVTFEVGEPEEHVVRPPPADPPQDLPACGDRGCRSITALHHARATAGSTRSRSCHWSPPQTKRGPGRN